MGRELRGRGDMAEGHTSLTLRNVFYVFFKHKATIVTIFLAVLILSIIYCVVTPAVYRAETKLLVTTGNIQISTFEQNRPEAFSALFQAKTENIRNEIELLKGQYLTQRVLARLNGKVQPLRTNLSIVKRALEGVRCATANLLSAIGVSDKRKEQNREKDMVKVFLDSLHVTYPENTDMLSIAFDWPDPGFAAYVANLYADECLAQRALAQQSEQSYRFYLDETQISRKKLKEAEDRLQRFLSGKNIADMALQKELHLRNIAELNSQYSAVAIEYPQVVDKLNKIREMGRNQEGWIETPALNSPFDKQAYLRTLDESYFRLSTERERLLQINPSESGEFKAIDRQLAYLRKQKLDSLLNMVNMELTLLQTKRAGLLKEISKGKADLARTNAVTLELSQLQRDRDIAEQSYVTCRKKVEELRISSGLEAGKISSVKIAIPALQPLLSAYPNKGLIVLLSAIAGLLLGFGVSAVKEYFRPTFRDERDVADTLGVPSLPSVPLQTGTEAFGDKRKGGKRFEGIRRLFRRSDRKEKEVTDPSTTTTTLSILLLVTSIGATYYLHYSDPHQVKQATHAIQSRPQDTMNRSPFSIAAFYPRDVVQGPEGEARVSGEQPLQVLSHDVPMGDETQGSNK